MVKTHLLTFEAFPETVALEGFDEETLRGLQMFMARVTDGGAGEDRYRVVARGGGPPRQPTAGSAPRARRPWRRHIRRDGEDIVMLGEVSE